MSDSPPSSEVESLYALLTECRERIAKLSDAPEQAGEIEFLGRLSRALIARVNALAPAAAAAQAAEPSPAPATAPEPVQIEAERLARVETRQPDRQALPELPALQPASTSGIRLNQPERAPRLTPRPTREPQAAFNWEQWLGEKLFLKLALILVVAGVAWAFKFAYDVGWWGQLPPLAKVCCGLLAGAGLLGTGIYYERRDAYRLWARGLIAAGWPLLYFTVYAAHHFEPSRIIHSPLAALVLLAATAGAAIAFSLRYKSELVTIAGYAFGYFALLLSGAAPGILVAGAVFTVSLAVLLSRFRWQWLGVTGLVGSAAVYVLHLAPSLTATGLIAGQPPAAFWASIWFPAVTWVAIALAGHVAVRPGRWVLPAYLTVKNAFVFYGCFALTPHAFDAGLAYLFPLALGAAHVALAVHARQAERRPLFVAEAAVGAALLLIAAAVKLTGVWLTMAWLSQAVVLVLLGVWFMERPLRASGYVALVLGALRVLMIDSAVTGTGTGAFLFAAACAVLAVSTNRARQWEVLSKAELPLPELLRWAAVAATALGLVIEVPLAALPAAIAVLAAAIAIQQPRNERHAGVQTAVLLTLATALACFRAMIGVNGLEPSFGLVALAGAAALSAGRFAGPRSWTALLAVVCGVTLAYAELPLTTAAAVIAASGAAAAWLIDRGRLRVPAPVAQALTLAGLAGVAIALLPGAAALTAGAAVAAVATILAGLAAAAAPEWNGSARFNGVAVLTFAQLIALALIAKATDGGATIAAWSVLGFGGLLMTGRMLRSGFQFDAWNAVSAATLGLGAIRALRIATLHWAWPSGALAPLALGIGALITALCIAAAITAHHDERPEWQTRFFAALAVLLVTTLITQECSAGWLSFGWSVEGALVLALGFGLSAAALRYTGVGLLLLTAAKVILFDIAQLPVQFRILSFIGLGVILLVASWAYTRHRSRTRDIPEPAL